MIYHQLRLNLEMKFFMNVLLKSHLITYTDTFCIGQHIVKNFGKSFCYAYNDIAVTHRNSNILFLFFF